MEVLKTILMKSDKNVLRNFISSYLLIFLLPIALLFLVYQFATAQLVRREEERVEQALTNRVQQLQRVMDEYVERSQAITLSVIQYEELSYILRSNKQLVGSSVASKYRIASQLKSLVIGNNFVNDIIVRVNEKDICINQTGLLSDESLYKDYIMQKNEGMTYNEWILEAQGFTGGKVICLEDGTFYFMQSFPITPRGDISRSITLIKFKDDILTDALNGLKDISETVCAIVNDNTGEDILASYQKTDFVTKNMDFNKSKGYFAQDGYLLAYVKSERIPITYVYAVSQAVVQKQKQELQKIAIVAFILCTILGCGLICFFTIRSLNPLKQLFALAKGENLNISSLIDPYSEIRSILLDAADRKLAYSNLHKQQNDLDLQRTFIAALYDKKCSDEIISYYAEKIGVRCDTNAICFIKLKCTDISSYFEKTDRNSEVVNSPIQLCETIVLQILSSSYNINSIRYGQQIIFIIMFDYKKIEMFNSAIKEELGQAQRFLRENYGVDVVIAMSDLHSGVGGLKRAFNEMNKTMEYIELTGNKVFARYNMVSTVKYRNEFNTVLIKEEAMMIGYVKSGDFTKAKTFFNEIVKDYFYNTPPSPQVLKFRLYALISNILGAINYVEVPDASKLIDKVNEHGQLLDCENVVEFQNRLNVLFDALEEFCRNAECENKDNFKDTVIDIVNENYMNTDLNVSMIANMVNKNLDYVSRTFKKVSGVGLLDYIHEVRIIKARQYLSEDSTLTIQQVSSKVGYISCESFIRVFKRKEGVTPGRYKAMIEQKYEMAHKEEQL